MVLVFIVLTVVISTAFGAASDEFGIGVAKCNDTGLDWYEKAVGETPCEFT